MIIPQPKKPEKIGNIRKDFGIHNFGIYEEDFFRGQKLLIFMQYSYGRIKVKIREYHMILFQNLLIIIMNVFNH